jgi:phosphatidylglycerol:prolipoprotein diacylglycerol transferase
VHPILCEIGPLTFYSYGLFVALGFLLAIGLASRLANRNGLPGQAIADILFWTALAAIVGSRILFVFGDLKYYLKYPLKALALWEGGLVFYGGVAAGAAVMIWLLRRARLPLLPTIDVIAVAVPLGHAFGRLGCFMAGCCYGQPTDAWYGVAFVNPDTLARPTGVPLVPTQLIEAGVELTLFLVLLRLLPRKRFHGQIALLWVLGYSVIRFLLELLRGDDRSYLVPGVISLSQGISLVIFAAAVVLWRRLDKGAAPLR